MKQLLLFVFVITQISFFGCQKKVPNSSFVNPFIGTDATHFVSAWRSEACTYPGAVAPHGMVQMSPETSANGAYLQGYYYQQDTIRRFSLTEHFSGWPDGSKGKVSLMPLTLTEEHRDLEGSTIASSFSHVDEVAKAGYYSVLLKDPQIDCEFTALTRSIIGRFDYQTKGTHGIIISDVRSLQLNSNNQLMIEVKAGSQYISSSKNAQYLILEFDHDFVLDQQGRKYLITFPDLTDGKLHFKYGASYTSPENAIENLHTEIPNWDFNRTKQRSAELWQDELGRIDVKGSERDKTMFYTALYHASLLPINATDENREFPGFEENDSLEKGETHYIYFTPWDAFRTTYPLLNLINPKKGRDYLRSALRYYNSAGRIPEPEVMTGVHFTAMHADALAKGITDFDVHQAFQGLSELLWEEPYFRKEIKLYDSLGYVPFPQNYATTATLEFAYNDWALAQVADYVGAAETRDQLIQRSFNYRNNYHPQERFMLTKNADGSWSKASVYAEADKWNMSWLAPHNTQDLINLMGGDSAFCDHLNSNFADGHFVLDNECPLNFPFLFSYAGQPWRTMEWKHKLLREYFNDTPGGIPGNDDWGSISSWFTWGALGLFPSCPGTDELILSAPIFEEVIIHLEDGKQLKIEAPKVSEENIYIQSCSVGGKEWSKPFMKQSDFLHAGSIRFVMGSKPNKKWGTSRVNRPYSETKSEPSFEVISFKSDRSKVKSDESFNVTISVRNNGALGSFEASINDGEEAIHSEWVLLDNKEEKSLTISVKLYKGGIHKLSIGALESELEVDPVRLEGAEAFEITRPEIASLVQQTHRFDIKSSVKNISGFTASFQPMIIIDGRQNEMLQPIDIQPGERIDISTRLDNKLNTGFHTIQMNSGPISSFKVISEAMESLLLHYKFDSKSTAITDHSGFENHGQLIGKVNFVDGVAGSGIQIDNGYVHIPEAQSLDISGDEMTLLAWYKPGQEKGMGSIITKGTHNMMKMSGKWQIKAAIGGWGKGQCAFNSEPNPENISGPIWLNTWTCFASVKSEDALNLFVNGDLKHQLSNKGQIGKSDFEWRIGDNAEKEGKRRPEGIIDEVMIFRKALSQEEIQLIMSSIKPQL